MFGKISAYTINWDKSELMFTKERRILNNCPFKIVQDHITYLGVKISQNPKHLLKLNLLEGIDQIKGSIDYWRTLALSMISRVNAIKMVSLPTFFYLFQNLPIWITSDF